MRFQFKGLITFIVLAALLIPLVPSTAAQEINYDITYTDIMWDISPGGGGSASGSIDILKVSSSMETTIVTQKEQLLLSLQVQDKIVNSNDTSYYVQVESDDEFYIFMYLSGVCVELYSEQVFVAAGAGTDTLRITVPMDSIETPLEYFNITSFAIYSPGAGVTFSDRCPDDTWMFAPGGPIEKPVEITNPTDGATVYGIAHVEGRTHNTLDKNDIKYVEVQVDDTDEDEWVRATSHDGYITWSYDWDTTEYNDDTHTVNARASNGTDEFSTSAEYWVDQATATSPKTMDKLDLRVGDKYWFEGEGEIEYLGEDVEMRSWINITAWGVGTIKVNGILYDTLIQRTEATLELTIFGFKMLMFTEGFTYLDQHTLSAIKVDQWINYTIPLSPPSHTHTVMTYDPPLDSFAFPMTVGDDWISETEMVTKSDTDGEKTETTTDIVAEYECLRTEQVTVPVGTFDTVVRRSENTSGGGEDIGSYSGTDSSFLTDGWSLTYYSEDTGYAVLEETYDIEGNIMNTLELVDYQRGTGTQVVVQNVSAGSTPKVGEETWIEATFKNTGGLAANDITVYFYDSEVNIHEGVLSLQPQETKKINISWTPSSDGRHVLMVSTPDHYRKTQVDVDEEENGNGDGNTLLIIVIVACIVTILLFLIIVIYKKRAERAQEVEVLEVVDMALEDKPRKKMGGKKKLDDD